MKARLTCLVPFCRRTRGVRSGELPFHDGAEWVCGPHWSPVPKRYRRALARAGRAYRRRPSGNTWRRHNRLWERCKRSAIEKAAGIA